MKACLHYNILPFMIKARHLTVSRQQHDIALHCSMINCTVQADGIYNTSKSSFWNYPRIWNTWKTREQTARSNTLWTFPNFL